MDCGDGDSMGKVDKYQTLILFMAIPIGLLIGLIPVAEQFAEHFVIPFLFVMLLGAFMNIPLKDYKKAFANVKFSITVVIFNFIWTPILVWLLGRAFLSGSPILQIGFIMLMVTPCVDWYLIFTGVAKGNVPLSASILPTNLILQIVLLPFYLFIFAGASGYMVEIQEVLVSITIMLILPFVFAQLGKRLIHKIRDKGLGDKVFDIFGALQVILLSMAVMAMFASKGRSLLASLNIVAALLIPLVLFYVITFVLSQILGKGLKYSYEDSASLTITTIAKNSPMTLGVALLVFPDEPLIHLIMIVEPLIELPVMMLITRVLLAIRKSRVKAE